MARILIIVGFLLSWAPSAFAFGMKGHASVERATYEELFRTSPNVIHDLVATGILRSPVSLDREDAYRGQPILSHLPDHSMDRQLQTYGQCFHFMASTRDVTGSDGKIGGIPSRMVVDAYQRCMDLVDALFRGILFDPADSRERAMDAYVLMHIVADSFSEAHVSRTYPEGTYAKCKQDNREDCSGRIAYLKSWRLRSLVTYLFHPSAWESYFDESHHGIADPRDEEYLNVGKPECVEASETGEGFVGEACLSDTGLRARDALVQVLTILQTKVDCVNARAAKRECSGLENKLSEFYKKYLWHALSDRSPAANALRVLGDRGDILASTSQIEASPPRDLGVGLSFDLTADQPIWLSARMFGLRNSIESSSFGIPDFSTTTLELRLPLQDSGGRRQLGAAFEYGIKLPINVFTIPNYALHISVQGRIEYTVAPVADGIARHMIAPGFGGAALDLTILNYLWLGVEGPRCMYRYDTWLRQWNNPVCYWGIKAGGTFGEF